MSRIAIPAKDALPQESKPLIEAVEKQLGAVPNLFRLVALSPAALQGFLANSGALTRTLDLKTRQRIALAVAQANGCDYCLSAHSYIAANLAKLDPEELALNRAGSSRDPKAAAAVGFARKITAGRGKVGDADFSSLRDAGYTDAEIVEIVAVTAENIFTNLLNIAVGTEIDFPVIHAQAA